MVPIIPVIRHESFVRPSASEGCVSLLFTLGICAKVWYTECGLEHMFILQSYMYNHHNPIFIVSVQGCLKS